MHSPATTSQHLLAAIIEEKEEGSTWDRAQEDRTKARVKLPQPKTALKPSSTLSLQAGLDCVKGEEEGVNCKTSNSPSHQRSQYHAASTTFKGFVVVCYIYQFIEYSSLQVKRQHHAIGTQILHFHEGPALLPFH